MVEIAKDKGKFGNKSKAHINLEESSKEVYNSVITKLFLRICGPNSTAVCMRGER